MIPFTFDFFFIREKIKSILINAKNKNNEYWVIHFLITTKGWATTVSGKRSEPKLNLDNGTSHNTKEANAHLTASLEKPTHKRSWEYKKPGILECRPALSHGETLTVREGLYIPNAQIQMSFTVYTTLHNTAAPSRNLAPFLPNIEQDLVLDLGTLGRPSLRVLTPSLRCA